MYMFNRDKLFPSHMMNYLPVTLQTFSFSQNVVHEKVKVIEQLFQSYQGSNDNCPWVEGEAHSLQPQTTVPRSSPLLLLKQKLSMNYIEAKSQTSERCAQDRAGTEEEELLWQVCRICLPKLLTSPDLLEENVFNVCKSIFTTRDHINNELKINIGT